MTDMSSFYSRNTICAVIKRKVNLFESFQKFQIYYRYVVRNSGLVSKYVEMWLTDGSKTDYCFANGVEGNQKNHRGARDYLNHEQDHIS